MNARTFHSSRQGSALVLVLWCVLLLSMAVFAVAEAVSFSADHATFEQSALEARTWAQSGAAVGQVPQLLADDPSLRHEESPGHGYSVTIESEAARLNLNFLLITHHQDVLLNLFTSWGVRLSDAQRAADCLYDWVTPGDLPSLDGAKADAYARAGLPQRPSHQPFRSWAEVEQVMGIESVAQARPDWESSLTLWSDGPLDLNVAPTDCMAALFGVDRNRVESLVKLRNGADGLPGTQDDAPVNGGLVQSQLGLSAAQMTALQNQFVFGSTVRRIESVGRAGAARSSISIVARLLASPPQFLVWSER